MKKLLCVLLVLLVSACATTTTTDQPTPAQIAARVCPPLTAGLQVVQTAGVLDPRAAAELAIVVPLVEAVCAAGTAVDASNMQALGTTGVPALLKVIAASPLPDDQKAVVTLAIATAHAVLAPMVHPATPVR